MKHKFIPKVTYYIICTVFPFAALSFDCSTNGTEQYNSTCIFWCEQIETPCEATGRPRLLLGAGGAVLTVIASIVVIICKCKSKRNGNINNAGKRASSLNSMNEEGSYSANRRSKSVSEKNVYLLDTSSISMDDPKNSDDLCNMGTDNNTAARPKTLELKCDWSYDAERQCLVWNECAGDTRHHRIQPSYPKQDFPSNTESWSQDESQHIATIQHDIQERLKAHNEWVYDDESKRLNRANLAERTQDERKPSYHPDDWMVGQDIHCIVDGEIEKVNKADIDVLEISQSLVHEEQSKTYPNHSSAYSIYDSTSQDGDVGTTQGETELIDWEYDAENQWLEWREPIQTTPTHYAELSPSINGSTNDTEKQRPTQDDQMETMRHRLGGIRLCVDSWAYSAENQWIERDQHQERGPIHQRKRKRSQDSHEDTNEVCHVLPNVYRWRGGEQFPSDDTAGTPGTVYDPPWNSYSLDAYAFAPKTRSERFPNSQISMSLPATRPDLGFTDGDAKSTQTCFSNLASPTTEVDDCLWPHVVIQSSSPIHCNDVFLFEFDTNSQNLNQGDNDHSIEVEIKRFSDTDKDIQTLDRSEYNYSAVESVEKHDARNQFLECSQHIELTQPSRGESSHSTDDLMHDHRTGSQSVETNDWVYDPKCQWLTRVQSAEVMSQSEIEPMRSTGSVSMYNTEQHLLLDHPTDENGLHPEIGQGDKDIPDRRADSNDYWTYNVENQWIDRSVPQAIKTVCSMKLGQSRQEMPTSNSWREREMRACKDAAFSLETVYDPPWTSYALDGISLAEKNRPIPDPNTCLSLLPASTDCCTEEDICLQTCL